VGTTNESQKHCQRRNQKINFGEATSDGHPSPFHLLLNFLTAVTETAWRPKQQCRDRFPRAATCYRVRGASLSPQAQAYSVVTSLDTVRCSHNNRQSRLHTRLTALCPGPSRWAGTRKIKTIRILLKQETVSGSGISWAICKSAHRSRQIQTPAPHHSVFYRPDALSAAQPTVSKHWRHQSRLIQRKYCLDLGLPVHPVMNDLRALKSPFDYGCQVIVF